MKSNTLNQYVVSSKCEEIEPMPTLRNMYNVKKIEIKTTVNSFLHEYCDKKEDQWK